MKSLIFACATLLMAPAVLASQSPDDIKEASYPLSQGATATLGNGVSVTLDSVSDSRCPEGKQCVRKGNITYSFTLRNGERSESFTLSDDTPSYAPSSVSGILLSMDPGKPPSPADETEKSETHVITLQVARR